MKILHVITTIAWGGAEKQLRSLVQEQINSGHDVYICHLKGIPQLEKDFTQSGAKVYSIRVTGNFVKQIILLRKYISSLLPDIVHAHLPRAEIFSSLALLGKEKSKLILTRHNAEKFFPDSPNLVSRLMSKFVIRRACYVIAISKAVAEYVYHNCEIATKDLDKLKVVYYGFSLDYAKDHLVSLSKPQVKTEKLKICTIARIVPQKDYPTLLRTVHELKYIHSVNIELTVVGSGALMNKMMQLSRSLNISDEVKWLGRMENPENFLVGYDVFVLSTHYEGFGLVLLEAIAAGLPVLASKVSAVEEVLGENSLSLFDKGDYQECARKVIEICQNPEFRNSLIDENRTRLNYFTISKTEELTELIYRECMHNKI